MTKIDLSMVDETFLNDYLKSIDIGVIKNGLNSLDLGLSKVVDNLEDILTCGITKLEESYLHILGEMRKEDLKKIEKIFNYTKYRKQENFIANFKKLNIKSCPFCNNNYIYFYKEHSKNYNTIATFEHYYPKAQYPHLSLSFYNLIPSCYICNSKFKGTALHVGNIVHPYRDDFHAKAKFCLHVENLPQKKDIELGIILKTDDIKCTNTIKRFHLNVVYEQHADIAKEIWNKAQVYNEDRINELYESFYKTLGYTKEEVKSFIFCNYLHVKEIHRRNHSKLTQDILKQIEL
jgi:hypothetical protein